MRPTAALTESLRWTCVGLLVVGVAACTVMRLEPAVTGPTLDGWAAVTKSTAGVNSLTGSASPSVCENLRRAWGSPDGSPYPIRCQYVRLDLNPQSASLHVAIGLEPTSGVLVFVGGPNRTDCEQVRAALGKWNSQLGGQWSWESVPCRPAALLEP